MSRNRHCSLVLTQRDFRLFHYLFCTKGAAIQQINRDIFGGVSKSVIHDRLYKLVNYGYIEKGFYQYGAFRTYYTLKKSTLATMGYKKEDLSRTELKSAILSHDFFLVDVRQRFLELEGLVQYLTENQLQAESYFDNGYHYKPFKNLNSDAFARIKIGAKEFSAAIEYEQSHKGRMRYEDLFLEYYATESIPLVIYICDGEPLQKSLMAIERNVRGPREKKFFYITKEEFLKPNVDLRLKNTESHTLTIPFQDKSRLTNSERRC